jgi:protoporphyrinogen oxidase
LTHTTDSSSQVVIIGAGPAGLTAAYELVKHGHRPVVLEKDRRYVGGLARTVEYKGFRFDIGGHRFFSKSQEIERLWEEICGEDFLKRARRSRILYRGRFFDYPLRAGNVFRGLGVQETMLCILSYFKYRVFPIRPELSFEDWVANRFGGRLFEIFFRTYTEKVWGMPCREISADWASQRIKGLSLKEAILNAFLPGRQLGGKTVKTLIDSFRYPRLGPGMMWERARDRIIEAGGTVAMDRDVTAIHHDGQRVTGVAVRCEDGREEVISGAHFISSMPLRELLERWNPAPPGEVLRAARELRYRDFIVVALMVRKPHLFSDNWIYVHDPSVRVGRIQNFRAWSPEMVPHPDFTCLGLEYFCSRDDTLWSMPDAHLVSLASEELEKMGLVRRDEVEDGCVVRVGQTYPVYDGSYLDHVRVIRQYLEQFANMHVVGRNGMHKYNNQDHSMMTALLAARNIMGAHYDVWRVNTDAEYLEEELSPSNGSRLVPLPKTAPSEA